MKFQDIINTDIEDLIKIPCPICGGFLFKNSFDQHGLMCYESFKKDPIKSSNNHFIIRFFLTANSKYINYIVYEVDGYKVYFMVAHGRDALSIQIYKDHKRLIIVPPGSLEYSEHFKEDIENILILS